MGVKLPSSRLICWVKLPSSSFVGGTCVYGTWSLFGNVRAGFVKILKNIKKYFENRILEIWKLNFPIVPLVYHGPLVLIGDYLEGEMLLLGGIMAR